MKWILLMQIIYSSSYGSGISNETVHFETEAQCETVAKVFLNDHKLRDSGKFQEYRVHRKATCIKLK